ncbi:MAG: site-2 protease family protein [Chloroflexota bacterium]
MLLEDVFTPDKIILIGIFLLVAFPVHEFAHALVAYRLGDATAKLYGRLTLNPIVHFDPVGGVLFVVSILFLGFGFGWAKPTPVNPSNLVDRRNGEVAVALAGPASNLVLAAIGALIFRGVNALAQDTLISEPVLASVLLGFVFYNVILAIFNLIPLPPLDGSALLFRVLSPQQGWQFRMMLGQYGPFLFTGLLLLMWFGGGQLIGRVATDVSRFLVGI